eukprot:CAMPEP_0116153002 /NCGR_PEP_ID=MMETSP0329-20121206/20988_1 /TAXON_ID=697910 /ORGANISM="Pseudo-nitzschia arenysensis, Strain B593" /LENGTH=150 /DNA_ID=CAMNT_0003649833 /DNA_START=239 /DNA_END=688 /DNA_ORIENTATION=+
MGNTSSDVSGNYVPFSDPLEIESGNVEGREQHPFGETNDNDVSNNSSSKRVSVRTHWNMFWAMSAPYFRETTQAKCMFGGLMVLMLLDSAARIAFSYLARDFWSALGDKDAEQFYRIMILIALCLLAPINVLYSFQRKKLAIQWRKWMTE